MHDNKDTFSIISTQACIKLMSKSYLQFFFFRKGQEILFASLGKGHVLASQCSTTLKVIYLLGTIYADS